MRWTLRNNYIADEDGNIVCILPERYSDSYAQIILKSPMMLEAINQYIEKTDSGRYPAKKLYNKFKNIVEDIPAEV